MDAFKYSEANIVGKHTYYAYAHEKQATEMVSPGMENTYVASLYETAFIVQKDLFKTVTSENIEIRTIGEFFDECSRRGEKMYSIDRFNYLRVKNHFINGCLRETERKQRIKNGTTMEKLNNCLKDIIV